MRRRTVFSFIVDDDPRFTYQGWHLACSLLRHCGCAPPDIIVQVTPDVEEWRRSVFRKLGCAVREINRFGDGRYCNKIRELDTLRDLPFERAVLLDTDTIAVSELRPLLRLDKICAKVVDCANPSLAALQAIAQAAGVSRPLELCYVDSNLEQSYVGNCNGGMYSVPAAFGEKLSVEWQRAATWLLDNIQLLQCEGKASHFDQVSFWLAIQLAGLPFEFTPSNANYFIHFRGKHRYYDPSREIALLHYHNESMNDGKIRPPHRARALRTGGRRGG